MPPLRKNLDVFMVRYFGESMGPFLVGKTLKMSGITDLESADEQQKTALVDRITNDCLSTIMSPMKARTMRAEIESIVGLKPRYIEGFITKPHAVQRQDFV